MKRLIAAVLLTGLLAGGCTFLSMFEDDVDPLCAGRADAADCDAALQAVRAEHAFAFRLERHTVTINPVRCDPAGCATWINVNPPPDECLPLWTFEATRPLVGAWQAGASLHGDPACAFDD